jgi:hypothetical protein
VIQTRAFDQVHEESTSSGLDQTVVRELLDDREGLEDMPWRYQFRDPAIHTQAVLVFGHLKDLPGVVVSFRSCLVGQDVPATSSCRTEDPSLSKSVLNVVNEIRLLKGP